MQPVKLELLAPAKNSDIGIAAIDCGADAVYIAGPAFGARAAAGNPVQEIARLAAYAHKFSARIYATVNTIIYDDELEDARRLIWELYDAGVDALIVQDLGITRMDLPPIELHASTQCAIRTPEQARLLESLGFRRLILERQLSLEEILAIRSAVGCELEFFVHGAICVSYSGNCYLSQYLAGRSANRGACIQACRSLYDVVDDSGRLLARDRAILSPKDFRLDSRLEELADAGICSFKIEGRLKNDSYVKNLVRHYRGRLDELCTRRPQYQKASCGTLEGGFTPNPEATFNRGYTQFYIDGRRSRWNSLESTKSIGEYIGTVAEVASAARSRRGTCQFKIVYAGGKSLASGDGLVFMGESCTTGMRADVVNGDIVTVKDVSGISPGDNVWRNYNIRFEKELQADMPRRKIDVSLVFGQDSATATDADGFSATLPLPADAPVAQKQEAARGNIVRNLGKRTEHFDFCCNEIEQSPLRFYPASALNALRRDLAEELVRAREEACHTVANRPCAPCGEKVRVGNRRDEPTGPERSFFPASAGQGGRSMAADAMSGSDEPGTQPVSAGTNLTADYSANCANHLARQVLKDLGYDKIDDAYELAPVPGAALMRSRYCIKYELGLCPRLHPAVKVKEPLSLVNAGRRLKLSFDCKRCEMIVHL